MPRSSVIVLSRDQSRRLDGQVWDQLGLPTLVLMENAAAALQRALPDSGTVVIVCGPGNNGGDGLALARRLAVSGRRSSVLLSSLPPRGADADVQRRLALMAGIVPRRVAPRRTPSVVVDALFGTGLTRPVEGPELALIRWMNRCRDRGSRVIAADIPSGLDADVGEPIGGSEAVRAHLTVTFAALKPGLLTGTGKQHAGRIIVDRLGLPAELIRSLAHQKKRPTREGRTLER